MVTIEGRRSVMMFAWGFARHAASKFGGMPREFFVEALRQTWTAILMPRTEQARISLSAILKWGEITGSIRDSGKWPRAVENNGYRVNLRKGEL